MPKPTPKPQSKAITIDPVAWRESHLKIEVMVAAVNGCFRLGDIEDRPPQASLHELSLISALHFLGTRRRPEVVILGIEPKSIAPGLELSDPVRAALPRLVGEAHRLLTRWRLASIRPTALAATEKPGGCRAGVRP